MTSDGTTAYMWSGRNQLSGLSGDVSASFGYDGVGRRRGKTISGTTTNFLYDGLNLVQELTSGGTPTANLLAGLRIDETLTRTDSGGTTTLLIDALGSTLALANASGSVLTSYTFEPFGVTTTSGTSSTNAAQFTGRENDGPGLYYYRTRYYAPRLHRFIGEDQFGFRGGPNLFEYAGDAPTNFVDALGLKPSPGFGQPPSSPGRPSGPGPGGAGGPDGQPGSGEPPRCSGLGGGGLVAVGGTVIGDLFGVGVGPALSVAYVPRTGEWFLGPGIGASLGHNFSFGPLAGQNPSAVLPGWTFGGGYNVTPWAGAGGVVNSSGGLAGNSFGVPGLSATATYGFCF